MREIILEKRYPHSREEDITDAFMRGYEIGKEQEHRWWSAFCANCKTEPQTAECPFDDAIPCEWACTEYGKCKYKTEPTISKMEQVEDETQTDCAWK